MKGAKKYEGRPGETLEPFDFDALKKEFREKYGHESDSYREMLSSALYPKVYEDYKEFQQQYGPVHCLDTKTFLVGPDIASEISVRMEQS